MPEFIRKNMLEYFSDLFAFEKLNVHRIIGSGEFSKIKLVSKATKYGVLKSYTIPKVAESVNVRREFEIHLRNLEKKIKN